MATTETPIRSATCRVCGATIPREDLSICPYCAAPLALEKKAEGVDPKLRERLATMPEHRDWSNAEQWTPPETPELERHTRGMRRGAVGVALGLLLAAGGLLRGVSGPEGLEVPGALALVAGALLVTVSARAAQRGAAYRKRALALPLMKRPAHVADRRSETALLGAGGRTIYYFRLQFQDGAEGEFRWLGRGTTEEPIVSGITGLAYTRGADLLAFKQIRV